MRYFVVDLVDHLVVSFDLEKIAAKIGRFGDICENHVIQVHRPLVSVNRQFVTAVLFQTRNACSHVLKKIVENRETGFLYPVSCLKIKIGRLLVLKDRPLFAGLSFIQVTLDRKQVLRQDSVF